MKVKNSFCMIMKEPATRKPRATTNNPNIITSDGTLMTRKLCSILRKYGNRVSIDNTLVLEILEAYMDKSSRLKRAEKEIELLKLELLSKDLKNDDDDSNDSP